jgi:antitoxin (DNA-binding transcriptional repressor) of toxin-antitoxin stability system
MKVITHLEFRKHFDAVTDAVAAGETYRITRDGTEVAELRPLQTRRRPSSQELVERHRLLPRIDAALMRQEADEFFGTEDRLGDDDPWERSRG